MSVVQKRLLIRGWSLKITTNNKKVEITLAVVDRWPLIRGVPYQRFDCTVKPLYTTATLGTPKKWPLYRGGRSVEGFQSKLVSKLAWPHFVRPLLTGGRLSEVAITTGLTVFQIYLYHNKDVC